MSLEGVEVEAVSAKVEPKWDRDDGQSETEVAQPACYAFHVVKTPPAYVKPEPLWDSDDADCELNNEQEFGSVVLKEELELGPVVLQPPDAVYALRALQMKEQPDCHAQAVWDRPCSVKLERMLVNMDLCLCKIGCHIYEYQSCIENDISHSEEELNSRRKFQRDEATHAQTLLSRSCAVVPERADPPGRTRTHTSGRPTYSSPLCDRTRDIPAQTEVISGENKSSRAGFLAAKTTESSETNKRIAPVEDKKKKLSEKIAKKNREPSAASRFRCDECGEGFDTKCNLEKRIHTHVLMEASTTRVDKVFTCQACNCTFHTKPLIQEHEETRHCVRYFACDKCQFTIKYALRRRHVKGQTGEKPFNYAQKSPINRLLRQYNEQFSRIDLFDCTSSKSTLKNRIQSLITGLTRFDRER